MIPGRCTTDLDDFDWDKDASILEFGVGDILADKYGFECQERVTLEVRGNPPWDGDEARLELVYDEPADTLRVKHPVRIRPDRMHAQRLDDFTHTLQQENTTHAAAIDGGANNTLAIVTTTGDPAVYHTHPEFERFRALSELIAELQSELLEDQYTSKRIQHVYDECGRRRDHSYDAAVKHAAEWLLERNVDTVYVGDLINVLETHWNAEVNERTHTFWSHRQLVDRLELTLGDVGITVGQVSEVDSSSECPECGSDEVSRDADVFRCHDCDLAAHSDVVGAWNLLQSEIGPMA